MLCVVVRYARTGPPRVGHRKTRWIFMIVQCSSRRLRCENQADHDAKTSSKRTFPGDKQKHILFFRSRDASRTGSSKTSRLGSHFVSIFDPQIVPTCPQRLQKSGRSGLPISKISLIRSFRLVRLVGLVWSRRLGRPGGLRTNVLSGYGLPRPS